ncbi:MAG TPA: helix-turn-helix domain-containing protein [Candidatus Ventrimonas merdavium]|nr:helix-turn-helix domain-containing protein [Candidatus Ventrimonas merdavium]
MTDYTCSNLYLDYDLISLSYTLQNSFQEGVELAAAILDAPILLTDIYGYIVAFSEKLSSEDARWRSFIQTRWCDTAYLENLPQVCTAMDPSGRGRLFCLYQQSPPTKKQRQLVPYAAWMLFAASQTVDTPAKYLNSPEGKFLGFLTSGRFDRQPFPDTPFKIPLPKDMQFAAIQCQQPEETLSYFHLLRSLFHTELVTLYQDHYVVALSTALTAERKNEICAQLSDKEVSIGLSYPFQKIMDYAPFLQQAVFAAKEASALSIPTPVAEYAACMPYDIFYSHTVERPLSVFRHPVMLALAEADKTHNMQLYKTLRIYVEQGGNISRAAEIAHMHRNSVLYRLKYIQKLTQYDVTDPCRRTVLRYAFALERVLCSNNM